MADCEAQAIADQAREYGWDLLDLQFTDGALPEDRPPSGALIDWLPTESMARRLRKMGVPAVRMGNLPHPKDHLLPAVLPDLSLAGRLAAEHFAERGFQTVGYVGRTPWPMGCPPLYEAFRDRARKLGCRFELLRLSSAAEKDASKRYVSRAHTVGRWLQALPRPIGLLAFSDKDAARLCTMCRRAGLSVPEDVAILSRGNSRITCETSPVALSSIDMARDEYGRQATILLHNLMRGCPAPRSPVMIKPRGIVVRRSTDVLAVSDPAVVRAMRFMWDHLQEDLSVDAIAEHVDTPRRTLERAFRVHLARGINQELRRKRLELCCELLRSSTITVSDIAPMIGFHSGDYLHATFKSAFGMTPRQYRLSKRQ